MKHVLKPIANLPASVFLGLCIVSSLTTIYGLRSNNENMIILRNQVYATDKADGNVNLALNDLRNYVYEHMNTNLNSGGNTIHPPIQLKYTYDRLESAAQAKANNANLYTEAEDYCQTQIPAAVSISGRGRIACVQDYILGHGGEPAAAIPAALYEFDFAGPAWSPDLAGWSLVVAAISLLVFSAKFAHAKLRVIK